MFQSRSYIKLEFETQVHSGPVYQIVSYMQYFSVKFAHNDVCVILFLLVEFQFKYHAMNMYGEDDV
jgi:hypothetical protein